MLYEESRARQLALVASAATVRTRVEWEQAEKLEKLQRSVRVARARLGMTPAGAS